MFTKSQRIVCINLVYDYIIQTLNCAAVWCNSRLGD